MKWTVLLFAASALFGQTLLQQGEQLIRSARYAEAEKVLRQAVATAPADPAGHYWLGSLYVLQWVPGTDDMRSQQFAESAERELQAALQLDPRHKDALALSASLAFRRAQPLMNGAEKSHWLDEAAARYTQLTRVDATEKGAWYSLGVIAWTKAYPATQQVRRASGMRPEDPGPVRDVAARLTLRSQYGQTVEDGVRDLEQALALDPKYDDAMAYLNLLYRLRADLQDDQAAYQRETATADTWVQRALETKKEKSQQASGTGMGYGRPNSIVSEMRQGAPPVLPAPSGQGGVIAGIIGAIPPPPPPPPPPPVGTPAQIRVGGTMMSAKLLRSPAPVYPPLAQQARIQGTVRFDVVVGRDGAVQHTQVVSGHPLLIQAAQDAVKQYQYQPTLLNGQPVEVRTGVDVSFTLTP